MQETPIFIIYTTHKLHQNLWETNLSYDEPK